MKTKLSDRFGNNLKHVSLTTFYIFASANEPERKLCSQMVQTKRSYRNSTL